MLAPELQSELERTRKEMQQGALPDDARHFRAIAGDNTVSILDDKGREPDSESRQVGMAGGQLAVSNPTPAEPPALPGEHLSVRDITRTINGERYHLNAASFFQANNDLLPSLIESAIGVETGQTAIELYCGVGLFTVPLARRFEKVIGVEGDAFATDFARQNLADANLGNAKIVTEDVADWLEPKSDDVEGALDFLLLDPPRTGAESRVISGILRLKPKRICYVSCDPATLARDLKKLVAGGYQLDTLTAFDMFPQTHHVETVARLILT